MTNIINISLVGGQTMPVHVGIATCKPDKIILVHSSSSKEEARKIADLCGIPSHRVEFPLNDYSQVLSKAQSLLDEQVGQQVYVNISSGTKHWAIAFAMLSVERDNVNIFYIDQNNYMHDLTLNKSSKLELHLDIDTILRYNNQKGYTYSSLSNYTKKDFEVMLEVKKLRHFHYKEFGMLTLAARDRDWGKELETSLHPYKRLNPPLYGEVEYDKPSSVVTFSFIDEKRNRYDAQLSSPHVGDIVFNAGWFEYEMAKMLSEWIHAKEVWMNVKFPYIDGNTKNEIDIIVNMGNKLLFVECKTNIYDNTDIDKFRTAVKTYGGMGSKALFITERIREITKEKCKDCGIMSFQLSGKKSRRERKEKLFSLLENELNIINKG